jgi:hypothetical protein
MAQNHVDTHPGIARVEFQDGSFASRLLAERVKFVLFIRFIIYRILKPEK